MKNLLQIRTEASSSLNFLVYLHNIFLNQHLSKEEKKFPYLPTAPQFQEDFEVRVKVLGSEILQRISEHPRNDTLLFHEEQTLFYHRLLEEGEENFRKYQEIYQSFHVWWNSFAGRISMERSVDSMMGKLYVELSDSLKQTNNVPEEQLVISLVYDHSYMNNWEKSPYFSVIPVESFFVRYEELLKSFINYGYKAEE